jgi:outer membrane protein assembly factor BamB
MLNGHHISTFSLDGSNLYFGAGYCLYRLVITNKEVRPVICTKDWTFQRPAVEGHQLYAHTIASPKAGLSFMAVDSLTSEVTWRSQTKTGEAAFRSVRDNIFVINERIYTAEREKVYVLDPESGEMIWKSNFNWMNSANPFLIHNNLLWYPVAQDNNDDGKLIAIDLTTGEVQQSVDLRPDAYFDQLVYIDDEWIFGLDSRLELEKDNHNHIFAVARIDLDQLVWYSENLIGLFGTGQVLRNDRSLIVSEGNKFIYALDINSGQVKWSFSPTNDPSSIIESNANSNQIAVFKLGKTLYGIDTEFGDLIWIYQLHQQNQYEPSTGTPLPLITKDVVYVGNVDTIDALEKQTGQLLWQVKVDSEYEYVRNIP